MTSIAFRSGIGDLHAVTKSLTSTSIGEEIMVPLNSVNFTLQVNSSPQRARAFRGGVIQNVASAPGEATWTLTLEAEYATWQEIGFYINQLPETAASVRVPTLKTATIPSTSPYEIDDAAIVSAVSAGIYVYISDVDNPNNSGYRTRAATPATPSVGEVGIDTTGNSLIFNSSDAGKVVVYTIPVTFTNREYYGGPRGASALTYDRLEFRGITYPFNSPIYIPDITFATISSPLQLGGDVSTLSIEMDANVPIGWDTPYQEFKPV